MSESRLTDRDRIVIQEIDRWRACLGRHIRVLADFSGQRACDRRLHKLIELGLIERRRIIYGCPGVYRNTYRAKAIVPDINPADKVRIEHLTHDIVVIDTAIYINQRDGIQFKEIMTEKQLHSQDGFGVRRHRPDFIYQQDNKSICVEVELTLKAKDKLIKNIKDNFLTYDRQLWIVPSMQSKITHILENNRVNYPNIEILEVSEVQKHD